MPEFIPLRISRSRAGRETKNRVILEQEPWDPYVGMLTKGGVVAYLRELLFGEGGGVSDECARDEAGNISGLVYAYPDPQDLDYQAGISHGELGHRIETELNYAELLQIQNETDPELHYPTNEIISATWATDAFAVDGEVLPRPVVDISGGRVRIAEPVYGTLLVIYKVIRHTYQVWISPRSTAAENKYQSYIYAVWDGGNNYLEFEPPQTVEDNGGRCNLAHDGEGGTEPPDDCAPPHVSPDDQHYNIDYCTGEVS